MNPMDGYAELKRRLLSAIHLAEASGFHDTARELTALLHRLLAANDEDTKTENDAAQVAADRVT